MYKHGVEYRLCLLKVRKNRLAAAEITWLEQSLDRMPLDNGFR